jgi:hypothetical protein
MAPVAKTWLAARSATGASIPARSVERSVNHRTFSGALSALALPAALDAWTAQRTDRPCRLLVTLSVGARAPALAFPLTSQR